MKFYIAASFFKKDLVKDVFKLLKKSNHTVTVDWTKHSGVKLPLRDHKKKLVTKYATRDEKGVNDADVFVLLSEPSAGRAMYVELGIAISNYEQNRKPLVYVVGKRTNQSIFYYHPAVKRKNSMHEVLEEIKKL
jgi:hypothetical protein